MLIKIKDDASSTTIY